MDSPILIALIVLLPQMKQQWLELEHSDSRWPKKFHLQKLYAVLIV